MKGTVKTLLEKKQCGFIRGEDGKEYFFHMSGLKNVKFEEITVGTQIREFEPRQNPKGPRAENIFI